MQGNEYQLEVVRTMDPEMVFREALCNWGLGIGGEAGEVIEHIKKFVYHGKPLDKDAVAKEIGDVLWYLGALCNTLGLHLDQVMSLNVAKLRNRYPNGFVRQDALGVVK